MWVGGALILQLLAIGLWRKADINDAKKRKIILFWAGQFLLTASLALLICHMGAGLGLSWGLLLLSFAVWPYFLWPLLSARQIGRSRESRKIQRELGKSKASNGSKWFLALRLFSAALSFCGHGAGHNMCNATALAGGKPAHAGRDADFLYMGGGRIARHSRDKMVAALADTDSHHIALHRTLFFAIIGRLLRVKRIYHG